MLELLKTQVICGIGQQRSNLNRQCSVEQV
jgi:hypothetical protein